MRENFQMYFFATSKYKNYREEVREKLKIFFYPTMLLYLYCRQTFLPIPVEQFKYKMDCLPGQSYVWEGNILTKK